MGMVAYTFINQLWRKKQSDVMSFLLQIRAWEYRNLPSIYRIKKPSRPEKARQVGYKSKQGFIVYRVRVRRGDRKRQVPKGITSGNQKIMELIKKNIQEINDRLQRKDLEKFAVI